MSATAESFRAAPESPCACTGGAGGGKILEKAELFDVYQGEQIESGKKSVAYSLLFRSADGTLTDEQIDGVLHKIFKNLKQKDCILRG